MRGSSDVAYVADTVGFEVTSVFPFFLLTQTQRLPLIAASLSLPSVSYSTFNRAKVIFS